MIYNILIKINLLNFIILNKKLSDPLINDVILSEEISSIKLIDIRLEFGPSDCMNLMDGFVYGLEQKDMSEDIAKCDAAAQQIMPFLDTLIKDIKKCNIFHMRQLLEDTKGIMAQLGIELPKCAENSEDIAKLLGDLTAVVYEIEKLPVTWYQFTAKIFLHRHELKADLKGIRDSLKTSDYQTAGEKFGEFLRVAFLI